MRAVTVITIVVACFVGYRYYIYYYEADLRAGMSAFKSGDYVLAHQKFRKYVNEYKLAREMMGRLNAFGLHGDENFDVAKDWFSKASSNDKEFANYAYYVGLDFLEPDGLAYPDKGKAKYWLQIARELGHADAANRMQTLIVN